MKNLSKIWMTLFLLATLAACSSAQKKQSEEPQASQQDLAEQSDSLSLGASSSGRGR